MLIPVTRWVAGLQRATSMSLSSVAMLMAREIPISYFSLLHLAKDQHGPSIRLQKHWCLKETVEDEWRLHVYDKVLYICVYTTIRYCIINADKSMLLSSVNASPRRHSKALRIDFHAIISLEIASDIFLRNAFAAPSRAWQRITAESHPQKLRTSIATLWWTNIAMENGHL